MADRLTYLLLGVFLVACAARDCSTGVDVDGVVTESNFQLFSECTTITGSLSVGDNITSAELGMAFANLTSVQHLTMNDTRLVDLNALSGVARASGTLVIQGNHDLADMSGLHNVTSVQELRLVQQPNIVSLSAVLPNLQFLQSLALLDMPSQLAEVELRLTGAVTDFVLRAQACVGLNSLVFSSPSNSCAVVSVRACERLRNLNLGCQGHLDELNLQSLSNVSSVALDALTSVNQLELRNLSALSFLSFCSLTTVTPPLIVHGHPLLSCSGLQNLATALRLSGTTDTDFEGCDAQLTQNYCVRGQPYSSSSYSSSSLQALSSSSSWSSAAAAAPGASSSSSSLAGAASSSSSSPWSSSSPLSSSSTAESSSPTADDGEDDDIDFFYTTGGAVAGIVVAVCVCLSCGYCCVAWRRRVIRRAEEAELLKHEHRKGGKGSKGSPRSASGGGREGDDEDETDTEMSPYAQREGRTGSRNSRNSRGSKQGTYISQGNARRETNATEYKYSAKDVLGEGVSGTVYKAVWHGSDIALKVIKKTDASQMQEFLNEVYIHELVGEHPNLINFLGAVTAAPPFMVALRFMPLGSLEKSLLADKMFYVNFEAVFSALSGVSKLSDAYLTESLTNLQIVAKILAEASAAIVHLHSHRVVHRDIAARNFLIDEVRHVVVCDFGMSRALQDQESVEVGTELLPIAWTAPECLKTGCFDFASDVYAYGVFMSEVLSRRRPHAGKNLMNEVIPGILSETHQLLPFTSPHSPKELRELMLECLAFQPTKRPSMQVVNERLRSYAAKLAAAPSIGHVFRPASMAPAQLGHEPSEYRMSSQQELYAVYEYRNKVEGHVYKQMSRDEGL